MSSTRRARYILLGILALAAFSTVGSSLATGAGQDPVAVAKARIAPYMGIPAFNPSAWHPAAKPFDASKAKGKVIFDIPISSSIPFIQTIDQAQSQAAKVAGVTIKYFPNQGSVSDWVKGMNEAIAQKVDLIILDAAPNPAQLQPQLMAAKKAGIPVIATHMPLGSEFPPGTLPPTNLANVTATVPGPYPLVTRLEADYAVANTPGAKVHALIVTSDDVASGKGIVDMTQAEFKNLCPQTCSTTVVNVPLSDWATKIQSSVQEALLRDPSINWVIPIYDSMSQFAVPGIRAAGKTNSVRIATFNGTPFVLKMIADHNVVAMDAGEDLSWLGWAFMDQALRILSGAGPVPYTTSPTPVRIWDTSNIAQAGSPPAATKGYGNAYIPGFEKLWGVKG